MKKFTKINEGYNLGRFFISDDDFKKYKNYINSLLRGMHSDKIVIINNLSLLKSLNFELKYGREFSVLNKVNTNILLLTKLVSLFKSNNIDDLLKSIEDNKTKLFSETGEYFNLVFNTIRYTEKKGEENEQMVNDYIRYLIKTKLGRDIIPFTEKTASYKDMILGIDITFNIDGRDYTCQVKPLKDYRIMNDNFIIESRGLIKIYKTNYIAFCNKDKNIVLLFRNNDMRINNSSVIINNENLVK
jgi:hypothetical protein